MQRAERSIHLPAPGIQSHLGVPSSTVGRDLEGVMGSPAIRADTGDMLPGRDCQDLGESRVMTRRTSGVTIKEGEGEGWPID